MNTAEEKTVAAVDIGSNSFHLKVARARGDQLVVVDRLREMVQLAAGLDAQDQLSEEAMARAMECLQRFGQRLRGIDGEDIRAVATNTLRRAGNAREFLSRAETALGHPIDIIAGREEARLIFLGVSHTVSHQGEQQLVVDIGGGSTEIIIGRRHTPILTESLYMGCVGMSRTCFPDGKITRKGMRAAELAALGELEPIHAAYIRFGWDAALGASGTIRTVEQILTEQQWSDRGITQAGLTMLKDHLIELGNVSAIDLEEVRPERAAVLPGGVAILTAVFEALGIERMVSADGALREGLLYDMLGRLEQVDVRESTISDLSERYRVDIEQAARVEQTALYLRAQVARTWRLRKTRYGDLLSWAARLHELGLAMAHNQYHKHGGYMLEHGDLPGFTRDEQRMLSVLVRAHRRKFPAREFEELRGTRIERTRRLAIILRLAVLLHRSRLADPLPQFETRVDDERISLEFPTRWLAQHPLTAEDLAQEAAYLGTTGLSLEFS